MYFHNGEWVKDTGGEKLISTMCKAIKIEMDKIENKAKYYLGQVNDDDQSYYDSFPDELEKKESDIINFVWEIDKTSDGIDTKLKAKILRKLAYKLGGDKETRNIIRDRYRGVEDE